MLHSKAGRPVIGICPQIYSSRKDELICTRSYSEAVLDAGGMPLMLPWLEDEARLVEALGLVDGLLIPGGEDVDPAQYGEDMRVGCGLPVPELDAMQVSTVRLADSLDLPLLGVCRGLQVINVALGGTLYQDIDRDGLSDFAHMRPDRAEGFVHIVGITAESEILGRAPRDTDGGIRVNSLHHQAVRELAIGSVVAAYSPDGVIEALEFPDKPILGVQWHPELIHKKSPISAFVFRWLVETAGAADRIEGMR